MRANPAFYPGAVETVIARLRRRTAIKAGVSLFDSAMFLHRRDDISYRDAAIVAAARALGADTLYAENLSHTQRYGNEQAINPFVAPAPGHHRSTSPRGLHKQCSRAAPRRGSGASQAARCLMVRRSPA